MLTDEQLEGILRLEFHAGKDPAGDAVVAAVRERLGRLETQSLPARRWLFAVPPAAGATAAVVLGVLGGAPALSAGAVADRTSAAVVNAFNEVAYAHQVETNASGAVVSVSDWWKYSGASPSGGVSAGRIETLGVDGSPITDQSWSDTQSESSGRSVDYATSTWNPTDGAPGYSASGFVPVFVFDRSAENLLDNGTARDVASTTLNGQSVIKFSTTIELYGLQSGGASPSGNTRTDPAGNSGLSGNSGTAANSTTTQGSPPTGSTGTSPVVPAAAAARAAAGPSGVGLSSTRIELTCWVDPTTYLPVQTVETAPDGTTLTSSVDWQSPDPATLAELLARVPSGFSELPSPDRQLPAGDSGP